MSVKLTIRQGYILAACVRHRQINSIAYPGYKDELNFLDEHGYVVWFRKNAKAGTVEYKPTLKGDSYFKESELNDIELKVEGKDGQKRNKTSNCCRCTHIASGAVGKSEQGRSQLRNKQTAFQRMAESTEFTDWHKIEVAKRSGTLADIERLVDLEMTKTDNFLVEIRNDSGEWVEENKDDCGSPDPMRCHENAIGHCDGSGCKNG